MPHRFMNHPKAGGSTCMTFTQPHTHVKEGAYRLNHVGVEPFVDVGESAMIRFFKEEEFS